MHVPNPFLTKLLADVNDVLRAQQAPLLMLREQAYGTGTHYSVVCESRQSYLGHTLCSSRNIRECGIWLEGFLAARRYEGAAAPQAEAYY